MWWFILAIVCTIFSTNCLFLLITFWFDRKSSILPSSKDVIIICIATLVLITGAIVSFTKYKQYIQSKAIDYYIMGEVEYVEKKVNGEVVDWWYIVKPEDHD